MIQQPLQPSPAPSVRTDSNRSVPRKPASARSVLVKPERRGHAKRSRRYRHKHHWSNLTVLAIFWSSVAVIAGGVTLVLAMKKPPNQSPSGSPNNALASTSVTTPKTLVAADVQPKREMKLIQPGSIQKPVARKPIARKSVPLELTPDVDKWQQRQSSKTNPLECDLPVEPRNLVDEHVFARLRELDIPLAKLSSDEAFLRRVSIDAIGTLPTMDEAKDFLSDFDPKKREKLIDQLLDRPEFADYWAMKWCDILRVKSEFPINLWPNAAQAYHRWIRTSIQNNMPYDQFARELLTSSGSNFRTPQVNFYRAMQSYDPRSIASAVALTFMGERTDLWNDDRLEGMSVFFSQVGYKPTGEWKEEIVYFRRYDEEEDADQAKSESSSQVVAAFPSGVAVPIPEGVDPRGVFTDWLVDKRNPWFARVGVNRVWHWLMGRGIVEPPDDVRRDNPPSHPDLLDGLADELIAADYDLRHVVRLILNSSTYQLSCVPASENQESEAGFASFSPRRLDAEVLIDAICQLTDTSETYSSITPEPFTFLPEKSRAIAIPDGSITSSFLEMFGRPSRDTGMVSERNNRLSAGQALHLLNSNHLLKKLNSGWGLKELLRHSFSTTDAAERMYLSILSRPPTQQELSIAVNAYHTKDEMRELAWALINSDEFLFQH